jgi:hypothetical protein
MGSGGLKGVQDIKAKYRPLIVGWSFRKCII